MFACLYSLSTPLAALVTLAEGFTPRFDVRGPLVMLDVSGLSRLFGSFREIGEQLRRSSPGPVRIAIAPTQTTAALLALSRAGLTVVEMGEQAAVLALLPVGVLGELDRLRGAPGGPPRAPDPRGVGPRPSPALSPAGPAVPRKSAPQPPHVGEMWDALPYFESSLDRTSALVVHAHCGGGWKHPRESHAASQTRQPRRAVTPQRETEYSHAAATTPDAVSPRAARCQTTQSLSQALDLLQTLRRWGIKTLGALAALPAGEVYERLGARGVSWQRLARGEDTSPLAPWIPEDPFEAALPLEWPVEGLEPLSFVLGRLLDPLSERLERADRGAAILHTHLRLVSKEVHARTLQLPTPMRDPKTLRTLVLLDLETHPPSAAVDEVRLLIEPTPARVVQWTLYERAQPSPDQTSTLLARLTALMGEGHVGSPQLVDTWKPGVFAMTPFVVHPSAPGDRLSAAGSRLSAADTSYAHPALGTPHPALSTPHPALSTPHSALGTPHSALRTQHAVPGTARRTHDQAPHSALGSQPEALGAALRRFRLPVPARVQVSEGRPVRITTDRRGVTGGQVVQAAGPWRTSGDWWNDGAPAPERSAAKAGPSCWDRDEWDVALADGTVYRLFVERGVGQWFLEGVVD